MTEFEQLFDKFKKLQPKDKQDAIIKFLMNDIDAMKTINTDIGNNVVNQDLQNISVVTPDDNLDAIYELVHVLTEQIEMFSEKVSKDFYE